ncbi:MAG: FAD:protein FMN transferase, partial [Spirochaetes bacterium]|nr:FAD:protein FMN transferase [Spirochaetota bacterium]
IFNLYDPGSELSRLNLARQGEVSVEMAQVLALALDLCARFDGPYDISHGKRFLARKQGQSEPAVGGSFRDIALLGREVSLRHPDLLLDLGSLAKGYVVDRLFAWLEARGVGDAFIDARGDMRIAGRHTEFIGIQDPRGPETLGRPIRMKDLAVATSGDYSQYIGDFTKSHLVGKRSFCSATIIASRLDLADALATAAMVSPLEKTRGVFEAFPECSALLVEPSGRTTSLGGFDRHLEM